MWSLIFAWIKVNFRWKRCKCPSLPISTQSEMSWKIEIYLQFPLCYQPSSSYCRCSSVSSSPNEQPRGSCSSPTLSQKQTNTITRLTDLQKIFFMRNIIELLGSNWGYDFLNLPGFVLVCLFTIELSQSLSNCRGSLLNVKGKCQQFTHFKTNLKILP